MPYLGEIQAFSGNYAPDGWVLCDGRTYPSADGSPFFGLFLVIKYAYGGDGKTNFAVPDLRGRMPIGAGTGGGLQNSYQLGDFYGAETINLTTNQLPAHNHLATSPDPDDNVFFQGSASVKVNVNNTSSDTEQPNGAFLGKSDGGDIYCQAAGSYEMDPLSTTVDQQLSINTTDIKLTSTGDGQPVSITQPSMAYNWIICVSGAMPATAGPVKSDDALIGEIRAFAGNFVPVGWLLCDGSNYSFGTEYTQLGVIIGSTYGGDNNVNFNVPDLRGRLSIGIGQGPGLSNYALGQKSGLEAVTMSSSQMPSHNHNILQTIPVNGSISATINVNNSDNDAGEEPGGNYFGKSDGGTLYASSSDGTALAAGAATFADNFGVIDAKNITITDTGNSAGIPVIQPVLAINWIICYNGIFPSHQ